MTPLDCAENLHRIRLIATDMDGTLTIQEKFSTKLLAAFDRCHHAGIQILVVTGRSAGWVSGLANYLPIWGAIAENGGLFYRGETQEFLVPILDVNLHRQKLAEMFAELQTHFPNLQESSDNAFRRTDWTFDVADLTLEELERINLLCQTKGWGFTYSTIQCHLKLVAQSKALGLSRILEHDFTHYDREQIATIGDSPNDESLFDASQFPISIGVANLKRYQNQLQHLPTYVTIAEEGNGFCEFVDAVLKGR
ncbi:HAD-superfamily hydrolase subfamily IIB [Leptolyngbya boryana NIES-2135]|jgi:HAD superfamily hydrolase (TIGR01484 family)|uniref:HAD-superfamily hydrolase subfamily IIB n=1 Tax=Leptolyngbya boryana NIES-2135 TaxID=1973484 RepID=A0A1Z4JF82_LEPBY|nr:MULTISPECIES: HAD family hydrolase [Leptolyngbya]BAY55419.1 HAD-superfamily hydrolase subfamily IIB [Leptolyngbya boryana NIES-2135]MBD1854415.1 HAD family phosphatase [Leptolyngbya sp. FACHB-1624]MBD2368428.1 HAD family phosphatase [Leptolyngbya sp. FACHB-161]MBD2374916.1 HAD family phosphatase [Leptolyngbya sp. FACHB-238]MBD2399336.1 HAD family phosphatase [Leptolyngbya sp. FACHB-239]